MYDLPPPATYIDTPQALHHLIHDLRRETLIALDTESNSMYAYRGRVCLIQVSTPQTDYIVDPILIGDMQPFGEILASPTIEKVLHAADYDLVGLKRDFDFEVNNLFDTLIAARLSGHTRVGLADMIRDYCQIELDKSHQLDNWGERPLNSDSLRYAQMDTHYLPALRDQLCAVLDNLKLKNAAYEICNDKTRFTIRDASFDPEGYWNIGRPQGFTRRQMSVLRELYLLREELAQRDNIPPMKLLTNAQLVAMTIAEPSNFYKLSQIEGIDSIFIRMYGEAILKAIEHGRASRLPAPPPRTSPDGRITNRYTVLHNWRKARADEYGLDPGYLFSKQTLWKIAENLPTDFETLAQIEGMSPWRLENYGQDILNLISQFTRYK